MIFGNLHQLSEYDFLKENIKFCFAYAAEHDLISYDTGRHEIDKDNRYVNIVEYRTQEREQRFFFFFWQYLDIHVMLRGVGGIGLNFIRHLKQGEFVPEDDFLPLEGSAAGHAVLQPGDFLICFPDDGHMTGIQTGEPQTIKKAIFKVKIQ